MKSKKKLEVAKEGVAEMYRTGTLPTDHEVAEEAKLEVAMEGVVEMYRAGTLPKDHEAVKEEKLAAN